LPESVRDSPYRTHNREFFLRAETDRYTTRRWLHDAKRRHDIHVLNCDAIATLHIP
jgi:hypothetical protein